MGRTRRVRREHNELTSSTSPSLRTSQEPGALSRKRRHEKLANRDGSSHLMSGRLAAEKNADLPWLVSNVTQVLCRVGSCPAHWSRRSKPTSKSEAGKRSLGPGKAPSSHSTAKPIPVIGYLQRTGPASYLTYHTTLASLGDLAITIACHKIRSCNELFGGILQALCSLKRRHAI